MKRYLVSVPVMARAEVFVEAESLKEAMEKAWLEADNIRNINEELLEPIYYDENKKVTEAELISFGIDRGYQVWLADEEFGEVDSF